MTYLTTHQAADILGVHDSSIKRWCSEDALDCTYTSGGHRRIGVQALTEFARTHQLKCSLLDLHPFEERVWRGIMQARRQRYAVLIDLVYEWVSTVSSHLINERHLIAALIRFMLDSGHLLQTIYDRVFASLLYRVGDEWEQGRLNVADEHRITQTIIDALYSANKHQYWGMMTGIDHDASKKAVVGCIQGNEHEVGALMVRHILEENGWYVIYLGSNVPHMDFGFQQEKFQAALVCISVTPPTATAKMQALLSALTDQYDVLHPYRIAIGGWGIHRELMDESTDSPFTDVQYFDEISTFSKWL